MVRVSYESCESCDPYGPHGSKPRACVREIVMQGARVCVCA